MGYEWKGGITPDVLCRYLSRAVTLSCEVGEELHPERSGHICRFILSTGAKYIGRAACRWNPALSDYATYEGQRNFIRWVHQQDGDVIFEACVFECISTAVNAIAIPAYVFRAFGLPPEQRNFSFDAMCFSDGSYIGQWGEHTAVSDITRRETRLFLYYRACEYIQLGYEALHMGQVHWIGRDDESWACWTDLLTRIRRFAAEHARRQYVLINAHTHGIVGSEGALLFDFHMYPSRPVSQGEEAYAPTGERPQYACFEENHRDSIYGKSLGGLTPGGWVCDSLPYLVELDNFGIDRAHLNTPTKELYCWGMDEISWFANQPAAYRETFLKYAYTWVTEKAGGQGFFALPGQRIAHIFDARGRAVGNRYYAFDPALYPAGFGDQRVIQEIFAGQAT